MIADGGEKGLPVLKDGQRLALSAVRAFVGGVNVAHGRPATLGDARGLIEGAGCASLAGRALSAPEGSECFATPRPTTNPWWEPVQTHRTCAE